MKCRLLWGASHTDADLAAATERYLNRIKHFFPIEVIEVPPQRGRQGQNDVAIMRAQSARLLAAIPDRGYVVVLDERGQLLDSLKFAGGWRADHDSPHGVKFVVGGEATRDTVPEARRQNARSVAMTLRISSCAYSAGTSVTALHCDAKIRTT